MEFTTLLQYKGTITQNEVDSILNDSKILLSNLDVKNSVKKKTYNLLVECVENILKYSETQNAESDFFPSICLLKKDTELRLVSGNLMQMSGLPSLIGKLEKINSYDKKQLQNFYNEIIDKADISDKGGAGLGLIDMALKSENRILFSFQDVNADTVFFELILTVNL